MKGVSAYALEEIDFSTGHKQDHRNWSVNFNPASGRLQVSDKFRQENKLNEDEISYNRTKRFIENIFGVR